MLAALLGGYGAYVYYALLIAAAVYAATRPGPKAAPLDDILKSTATRGAYVPLVIGRARVGPVFAWVDNVPQAGDFGGQPDLPEQLPGFGKGSGGAPDPLVYKEKALHLLAIGPGSKLIAIYQNGDVLWRGPITPASHPSGSRIGIAPDEGIFEIHWGFADDPELLVLEDSTRHGLLVRYSHVMKILWDDKSLGGSRQWPRLEYEIECPCYSQLNSTAAELPLEGDDDHPTWEEIDPTPNERLTPNGGASTDPVELHIHRCYTGTGAYDIKTGEVAIGLIQQDYNPGTLLAFADELLRTFPVGGIFKVGNWDNSAIGLTVHEDGITQLPDPALQPGAYATLSAIGLDQNVWEYFWIKKAFIHAPTRLRLTGSSINSSSTLWSLELVVVLGPKISGNLIINQLATLPPTPAPFETMIGAAEPVRHEYSEGVNPIHMIDQLLFAKEPYGIGKDRSKFDPRSIEDAAVLLESEEVRGFALVEGGEALEGVLAQMVQDIGVLISWDPEVGKFVFVPMRYDQPLNVTDIPPEMILRGPEMATIRGPRPIDTLAFTFKNRERNYREDTLVIADDGQISESDATRAKKITIGITNDPGSATRILPRRQMEALASTSALKFECNHGTQMAVCGKRVKATATEGEGLLFRIMAVQRDVDSSKVVLDTLLDAYDPPVPTAAEDFSGIDVPPSPEGSTKAAVAANVIALDAIEVPRALSGGVLKIFFPTARSSALTTYAAVWGSQNGSSYALLGNTTIAVSGTLDVKLPGGSETYDETTTYDVTPLGIDFDQIEDLSLNETSWRAGRQILLIENEVIYLREGGADQLQGLIRGRLGTVQALHAIDTPFVVILAHTATLTESPLFIPGREVFYKLQGIEQTRAADLANSIQGSITIQGLAFTPLAPPAVRQASLRPDYDPLKDLELLWSWHSDEFPRTGLGTQGAGQPTGLSSPKGYFIITVKDNLGTKLIDITALLPELILEPADRATIGSLDGLPFWTVEVRQVEGSFTSLPTILTLQSA